MIEPYYDHAGITLYHCDCKKVLTELKPKTVGMVFTDPPYSSGGAFRGDRTNSVRQKYQNSETFKNYPDFLGDHLDQRAWAHYMTDIFSLLRTAVRPGAIAGVFTDWRQLPSLTDACQIGGFIWRGISVWDKTPAARPVKGRPRNQCEYIVWGTKGPRPIKGNIIPGCFTHSVFKEEKKHITEKPVAVCMWFLSLSEPDDLILDPFAGSGTALLAAKELGRRAIGIEIEEQYCEIAAKRLEQDVLDFRKVEQ